MSFDDLLKELQGQKSVEEEQREASLEALFKESFMREHSRCQSFEEFLAKGNFQVSTREDIDNLPEELFDRHVARETDFPNWTSMLNTATSAHNGRA
ncbi:hypothetical protein BVG16_24075 [Paenibacillus selenitireducens]|uniref:Uncharacterized protein n=1 Tax=Paenibacillus selenitireducens TaxID=1324314 RepID=A0A1T2X2X8_9BACL|nr:hypothetical protein [Paenibacillus selenitireducens]OPA74212.1 hypothetical protein BVG16_24075 [Paenibacillus selenitireducens]